MALDRSQDVFEELLKTFEECRQPNWDGYGAQAVREETYHLAHQFLKALPLSTPVPSIGAEPDGHITVEWYRSPERTLSVSISPDGDLHFAALLKSDKTCGAEALLVQFPKSSRT
jgi:hypothetical protein